MAQNYKKSCICARDGWHNLSFFIKKNSLGLIDEGAEKYIEAILPLLQG
jgi:hypothetical protein